MVNVVDNYKLIDVEIDGEVQTIRINPTEAWAVMKVVDNGNEVVVNKDDNIEFVLESGEVKTGTVLKLLGKGEKTRIQMVPKNSDHEEIWSVLSIQEGTLKVL